MNKKCLYSISLGGRGCKEQSLEFVLDNEFFAIYPESEIKKGDCKAKIFTVQHNSFLEAQIEILGEVAVQCDRCLEELNLPIEFSSKLIVKSSPEVQDAEFEINTLEEDIIWVNPSENELDLTQYLYDSINLTLPFNAIHGENGNDQSCDSDMLERFIIEQ